MLTLHYHPFASFCQKVLIALYENDIAFTPQLVDFGDPKSAAAFRALWPIAKMPVLQDSANGRVVPESSIIIEYLALHHPGPVALIPADPQAALGVRLADRFYDLYVQQPLQAIVADRLRPEGARDPFGVAAARDRLATAYAMIERDMAERRWAAGEDFSMADCAAGPALFYADWVAPLGESWPNVSAYLARLVARPSFARVIADAEPYRHLFPR